MSVKYCLVENLLTEREDDYSAQVHGSISYDNDAIVARMVNRGNLLTKVDIGAVLEAYFNEVEMIHDEGGNINTPIVNTSSSISGVFNGPLDTFDPNRHKYNINTTKGTRLRAVEKRQKLEKTNTITPQPNIQEVKDSISGKVNEDLTPNGVIEVRGYSLKISGDERCGLWFIPTQGEAIKATIFIENKPSTVIAIIPALAPGNYNIRIVTQHSSGKELKEPKSVIYPKTLTVQ
jgi:hypothetical protein